MLIDTVQLLHVVASAKTFRWPKRT